MPEWKIAALKNISCAFIMPHQIDMKLTFFFLSLNQDSLMTLNFWMCHIMWWWIKSFFLLLVIITRKRQKNYEFGLWKLSKTLKKMIESVNLSVIYGFWKGITESVQHKKVLSISRGLSHEGPTRVLMIEVMQPLNCWEYSVKNVQH